MGTCLVYWNCFCKCVCVCVCVHSCAYTPTWVKSLNGKSSLHVRSKREMKSVLNSHIGKLSSEVVSFWQSEIWVWWLSSNFVNYLPFRFYRHLTTEKQQCRPRRLPGIVYPFKLLKGVCPLDMQTKVKSSFEVSRICRKKHDSHSLEDTFVRNMLLKAICLTSTSIAVHSNVIKELEMYWLKFSELYWYQSDLGNTTTRYG